MPTVKRLSPRNGIIGGNNGGNIKVSEVKALKFRYKRRVLVAMWTLWFAYLSFTQESVTVSAAPRSIEKVRLQSLQSQLGDTEPSTSVQWAARNTGK